MIKKLIPTVVLSIMIAASSIAQTPTSAPTQAAPTNVQAQPAPAKTAIAQSPAPAAKHELTVKERQEEQQKRIANGEKSGELTPKEAEQLEKHEAKVQHDKKVAKSDGAMTPEEKEKLAKEQNKTSKAIHEQKHDAQKMNEPKHDEKK